MQNSLVVAFSINSLIYLSKYKSASINFNLTVIDDYTIKINKTDRSCGLIAK